MKKVFSLLFCLIFALTFSSTAFASDSYMSEIEKTVNSNGFSFEIIEQVDEHGRIIRTFEEASSKTRTTSMTSVAETKALLSALGMHEKFIDNLSDNALANFSNGEHTTIVTVYTRTDENNEVTILDEETALREASILKAQQNIYRRDLSTKSSTLRVTTEDDYYRDSYMRVDYAVTYNGQGEYFYSVDAEWLTMPAIRGTDSLGACSMTCTVTPGTQYGYYFYDITNIVNGDVFEDFEFTLISSNYKNAISGNWYGSAGYFNLPNDVFGVGSSVYYDNFCAHFEFEGHKSGYTEPDYFNTVGSYTHSTIQLILSNPSINIDLSGDLDVTASIGLSVNSTTDVRGVELEIHHLP